MTSTRPAHGGAFYLSCLTAFLGGMALAAQSRLNGRMAGHTGDALWAATFTFASGWALLTLGLLMRTARAGLANTYRAFRSQHLRAWVFFSGFFGASWVTAQAFAVPLAGVALFMIGAVGGQTGAALLIDKFGLGPAGRRHVTLARIGAVLLALVGVSLAVSGRLGTTGPAVVVPVLAAVAGGAAIAMSAAYNGRLNVASRNFMATTWINFTWGTVALVAICVVRMLSGAMTWPSWGGAPWWAYLAGLLGVLYVANSSVVVRYLGVLLLMLMTLAGQMSGALVFDALDPAMRRYLTPVLLVGVVVTLVAAAWAAYAATKAPTESAG
ncbi:DMT family transporter [Granulicoccus sp. GXG6511]|uniref:DMT family transporter n=1 Tax=Granulicoccus sp. GXG6511 TaxID=3381351 RepID=UPI003D7CA241